jgi:DNA ligase (NAD+)
LSLPPQFVQQICQQKILLADLSTLELVQFCEIANTAYRAGEPIITDEDYDFIYLAELRKRQPTHALLQQIEPEGSVFSQEKIRLPELMLSIDKAYTWAEVEKWFERIKKTAQEIDFPINTITIKATSKLDGFAGFDDGVRLYTRGDGKRGSNISRVFERGLSVFNDSERGQGAGEIVVKKSYFEQKLAQHFEHPRNFQASLIKEKALELAAQQAIKEKAALFVPFTQLPCWRGSIEQLSATFDLIVSNCLVAVDFDVDGVVFEVENIQLKTKMGANRKFHRWQIAFKENKDKAQVRVIKVTPQVGRTGKVTPVAELEPTILSGATINRATGHHYSLVKTQGLGAGSIVELTRSGLVIPKINKVLKPVVASIPTHCPSCGGVLTWEADFLICLQHQECPDQLIGRMEYFFKTLANNDGFGVKTIEKLYSCGIRKVGDIYALTLIELTDMGFGEKTAKNLQANLRRSRTEIIEDWRFLAAFGITRLGTGNAENLLKNYTLTDIFTLSVEQVATIEGFAQLSAQLIVDGLLEIKCAFTQLLEKGFNLELTSLHQTFDEHIFLNKRVVFTGKMSYSRDFVKKQAKSIGIKVMSGVSKQTDYLIVGEKVGEKKIQVAQALGVEILNESDYLLVIQDTLNN